MRILCGCLCTMVWAPRNCYTYRNNIQMLLGVLCSGLVAVPRGANVSAAYNVVSLWLLLRILLLLRRQRAAAIISRRAPSRASNASRIFAVAWAVRKMLRSVWQEAKSPYIHRKLSCFDTPPASQSASQTDTQTDCASNHVFCVVWWVFCSSKRKLVIAARARA